MKSPETVTHVFKVLAFGGALYHSACELPGNIHGLGYRRSKKRRNGD